MSLDGLRCCMAWKLCRRAWPPVTWLAFHQHQDQQLPQVLQSDGLMSRFAARSQFVLATSLPQVMDVFSRAQLVLPMRLHALILAQLPVHLVSR